MKKLGVSAEETVKIGQLALIEARSEECKELNINQCDGLSPFFSMQVNACKNLTKGEASSGSADMLALTDSSKQSLEKKESDHGGKRRKVNDESESCSLSDIVSSVGSCGKDDEFISAKKELPEDDPPPVVFGNVVTKNMLLRGDAEELDSSISAGVSAIFTDQIHIIFALSRLLFEQPLDSHSILVHIFKLEKKNAEFLPFVNVSPSMFDTKILEYVDITFKLSSVCMRLLCGRSVHSPYACSDMCHHAAEIVTNNFEINMMIKRTTAGSRDKIRELCKSQNEEVIKMIERFHEKRKFDPKSVTELFSSITVINASFFDLVEILPEGLPAKLSDMNYATFKLWRLCLEEDGTPEGLPKNGTSASQELKDA